MKASFQGAVAVLTFAAMAGTGTPANITHAEENAAVSQSQQALENSPLVPILRRGNVEDVLEGLKNLMNSPAFATLQEEELIGVAFGFGYAAKEKKELSGQALELLNQFYEKIKNDGTSYVVKSILDNMAETAYADKKLTIKVLTLLQPIVELDSHTSIRSKAVQHAGDLGLSQHGRPDNSAAALAAINKALGDRDEKIRQKVAFWNGLLGMQGGKQVQELAISTLAVLLKDSDSVVRRQAADSISNTAVYEGRSDEVQHLLEPLLRDEDAEVRHEAENDLAQIKQNTGMRTKSRRLQLSPAP